MPAAVGGPIGIGGMGGTNGTGGMNGIGGMNGMGGGVNGPPAGAAGGMGAPVRNGDPAAMAAHCSRSCRQY
ncbi:hypothetical protein MUNTM_43530 [Mycobacterium sp. MUNTM1]